MHTLSPRSTMTRRSVAKTDPTLRAVLFAAALAPLGAGCGPSDSAGGADLAMAGPDLAQSPDLADPTTVTVTMDSFVVPAGGEIYKCQNFPNPFGGMDVEVQQFESHMTPGSHHMLVFYKSNIAAKSELADCSGLEFAATPYGSQRRDDIVAYPPGVAALIPGTQGLRLQSHYLNATNADITASVRLILHKAAPGTVKDHAGVLFFVNTDLNIPSTNMPVTIAKTCPVPLDVNILGVTSHMHKHGTGFTSSSGGKTIYETNTWDEPTAGVYNPAIKLLKDSTVTFSCTWINDSGAPLTFGESAGTNEMCIFAAQFYPIVGNKNIIPCF